MRMSGEERQNIYSQSYSSYISLLLFLALSQVKEFTLYSQSSLAT